MPASSLAALAALSLVGTAGPGEGGSEAERYLRLCLGRSFGQAVIATLDQRDPTSGSGRVRAQIVRDARGRMRTSILSPPALQGNEILDDGRRMSVLLTKEKLVMIQDSPAVGEGSLDGRIALVGKNYRLSVTPGPKMFERQTVVLEARARWRGIESRRYLLDAATGYPLRHDILVAGGTDNLFSVVSLKFAERAPRGFFQPFSTSGRQVVRYASAASLKVSEAKARVGFDPVIPKELPFGFRISHIGLNDTPDWRSVVFRASDGLIKAHIYEWVSNPADAGLKDVRGRSIGRRGGRTVMVVSDGSTLVRSRLLDTVLDAMRSSNANGGNRLAGKDVFPLDPRSGADEQLRCTEDPPDIHLAPTAPSSPDWRLRGSRSPGSREVPPAPPKVQRPQFPPSLTPGIPIRNPG